MPEQIASILEITAIAIEGVGYLILVFTSVKFVLRYIAFEYQRIRGFECVRRFREIRLELLSHIILAVDFMVVADVINSGLVQTRDSLIDLGLLVLIRSVLAFFLGLDMKDARDEKAEID